MRLTSENLELSRSIFATRRVAYFDRDRVLADLGLEESATLGESA
jgi:hypothetical protein